MDNWLGGEFVAIDRAVAEDEVLRYWLRSFGPGTEVDIKWWTGWPVTRVRRALSRVGAVEVELDDDVGFLLENDTQAEGLDDARVELLPSLDPTTMGWKQRDWYLGDLGDRLFDRNGNAGPTIWAGGRVIGGWTQRSDGEIAYEILGDVSAETTNLVESAVDDLTDWMGDINVTARFRSPHDRELAG